MRRVERTVLKLFGRFERPMAWILCIGAVATFTGVATGLIVTGELRLLTLVGSADLAFAGYGALRAAYDQEDETG